MTDHTQEDYKVLVRSKPGNLAEDVAEWTADGYRLVGGVCVYKDHNGEIAFAQAVAKS